MDESKSKSIGARWILPVDQPPLRDASLTLQAGVIRSVNPSGRTNADDDLGEVVLIPKFVNAHTHLEFSDLTQPIGQPGMPITDWIPQVVATRQRAARSPREAVGDGIRQSRDSGTIAIGEIATSPWFHDFEFDNLVMTCFVERLGNQEHQCESTIAEARQWLSNVQGSCRTGISPHAPYSLHDDLFNGLVEWAVADNIPVAMHLAESREELRWLADGSGPFRDMLESMNALGEIPGHRRPMHYLDPLARTSSALIVHGNYLSGDELDFIARHDHLHLVYCPRTHEFFEHDPWPLNEAIGRGINVAIGTDSLASNPDLGVRGELVTIKSQFPGLDPAVILAMGTIQGAKALGIEQRVGSLTAGKLAEYLVFPATNDDPWASLFE
ncbi:MAG: amidohydrolase family protein [Pirellulaceae bacterium]